MTTRDLITVTAIVVGYGVGQVLGTLAALWWMS